MIAENSVKQLTLFYMNHVTVFEVGMMRRLFTLRRIHWLTGLMKSASRLGDWPLWVVTGLCLLASGEHRSQVTALAAALAAGLSVLIFKGVKNLVGRPRPFESWQGLTSLVPVPDKFSFPSGHTMTAFAVWAVLAHGTPALALPFLGMALLIGISRIFLGMHYPTDVLVGALLGSSLGRSVAGMFL
jgi:undecaprenyl-diphosphatase